MRWLERERKRWLAALGGWSLVAKECRGEDVFCRFFWWFKLLHSSSSYLIIMCFFLFLRVFGWSGAWWVARTAASPRPDAQAGVLALKFMPFGGLFAGRAQNLDRSRAHRLVDSLILFTKSSHIIYIKVPVSYKGQPKRLPHNVG